MCPTAARSPRRRRCVLFRVHFASLLLLVSVSAGCPHGAWGVVCRSGAVPPAPLKHPFACKPGGLCSLVPGDTSEMTICRLPGTGQGGCVRERSVSSRATWGRRGAAPLSSAPVSRGMWRSVRRGSPARRRAPPGQLLAPLHLLVVGACVLVARHVARLVHQVHAAGLALAPARRVEALLVGARELGRVREPRHSG